MPFSSLSVEGQSGAHMLQWWTENSLLLRVALVYVVHTSFLSFCLVWVSYPFFASQSDMLMTYYDATYSEVGRMAEAWTRSLIVKLNASAEYASQKPISGPFSLDFILAANQKDL